MKRLMILLLLLALLMPAAHADGNELREIAVAGITEVLGYTAREAADFVFEPQADGSLRYWPKAHPDWVYASYYEDGNVRGSTPFDTGYVRYSGENAMHEALRAAREQGWFAHWDDAARTALLGLLRENGVRVTLELAMADSAALAVDGLLESCCGPQPRWTDALRSLRDGLLAEYGLTAARPPFRVPGVRSYTAPDRTSPAERTIILFDGQAPELLQTLFDDPRLSGWTLTTGALRILDWGDNDEMRRAGLSGFERDGHINAAWGLAAMEKDGHRRLFQITVKDDTFALYPLGERALRQTGDYRVGYDSAMECFTVVYPLNADETLTMYLTPVAFFSADGKRHDQVYCNICAGERVNRRTGEAQWLGLNSAYGPTWKDQWEMAHVRPTMVCFMPFLGMQDIADFPLTLEEGKRSCLPEDIALTQGVNFRSKTSSHSKAYGELLPGVPIPILDVQPGDPFPWVHTRLGFHEGYVVKHYVRLGTEQLSDTSPQTVAKAKGEIPLKRGPGLLDGTVQTLLAGTVMHVIMEENGWLYVSVPRGEADWLMDQTGTFGYVKAADVWQASMLCQLDWMEEEP